MGYIAISKPESVWVGRRKCLGTATWGIQTCRQRGLSPSAYIAEVMAERHHGRPTPIVPAPVAA
jgi:hypothetical protein